MINLGHSFDGDLFQLPDIVFTARIGILSKTGAGKSYTASVILEEFLEKQMPVVIIDPVGHHYGLREKYPVILFGGKCPDYKIDCTFGRLLARFIIKINSSVLIDLSEFYKKQQEKFIIEFLEELMNKNGRQPRHILLEEANNWIPQNLNLVSINCFDRTDKLVRQGRGEGLGVTLLSQRPQLINKNSLSQCDIFIFLQMVYPNEIAIVKAILNAKEMDGKQIYKICKKLPGLAKGEAIIYAPGLLNNVEMIRIRQKYTTHTGYTPQFGIPPPQINLIELENNKETKEMMDDIKFQLVTEQIDREKRFKQR